MELPAPRLDHLVIDVRDRIGEAERLYSSLGFQLTERSRHTIGSMNRLIVFGEHYIELLGFDPDSPQIRADIAAFPVGLNGLVFGSDDADGLAQALKLRGVAIQEPATFSRHVHLREGVKEARFRVVRLAAGTTTFGRTYFCQHLTQELIWRHEWQQHPNGAIAISKVTIAVRDVESAVSIIQGIFGADHVQRGIANGCVLKTGGVDIDFVRQVDIARLLGDAAPDPAFRADFMALITIQTQSLQQTAALLHTNDVKTVVTPSGILRVPATEAMNVTVDFRE